MFEITYSLLFDFINMLKWLIPVYIVIGIVGDLIMKGAK